MSYLQVFNTVAEYEAADLSNVLVAYIKDTGDVLFTNSDISTGISAVELENILNTPV